MVHKTSSWKLCLILKHKKQLVPIAFFQSNSIVNVAISGFHPDPPKKKNTSAVDHLHVFKEPMAMITSIDPTQSTHIRSDDDGWADAEVQTNDRKFVLKEPGLCKNSRIFNNIQ